MEHEELAAYIASLRLRARRLREEVTGGELLADAIDVHGQVLERVSARSVRNRWLAMVGGGEEDDYADLSVADLAEALNGPGLIVENVREIRRRRFTLIEGGAGA